MGFYEVSNSLALELQGITDCSASRLTIDWASYRHGGSTIGQRWAYTVENRDDTLAQHNQRDPIRREQAGTLAEVIERGGFDLVLLQQNSKRSASARKLDRWWLQHKRPVLPLPLW